MTPTGQHLRRMIWAASRLNCRSHAGPLSNRLTVCDAIEHDTRVQDRGNLSGFFKRVGGPTSLRYVLLRTKSKR